MDTKTRITKTGTVALRAAAVAALAFALMALAGVGAGRGIVAQSTKHMPSVRTSFNRRPAFPDVHPSAYVHPLSAVIGSVTVGRRVMIAPGASVRGDEGTPIYIGDFSNVQDGVVIHALETSHGGKDIDAHRVAVAGGSYAVYVDVRVSLDHQCCVHGPALIGHDTVVGMQALVYNARVGGNCVIEPGAKVFGRLGMIEIPDGRHVPAGQVVTTQAQADALPQADENYPYAGLNRALVEVNVELADGYKDRAAD
jgi:carbonic anhydrase/acetyltransferase-like protein (isoleucine patch superfamily)